MKIGVLTLDIGNLNFSKYSIDNTIKYCNKWGYEFLHYQHLLNESMAIVSNKIIAVYKNLRSFDYLFLKDLDSLFYDFNKPLESLIDENYNYIASAARYGAGRVNTGHILFKNCNVVEKELRTFIQRLNIVKIKGDQSVFNQLAAEGKITKIKVLDKNILNASVTPFELLDIEKRQILNKVIDTVVISHITPVKIIDNDLSDNTLIIHFFGNLNSEKQGDFNLFNDNLNKFIKYYNQINEKFL